MDEQKTSAVTIRQDETKTSPVTVFDMGSLLRTLQALAEEKPEQNQEIDLSWIESAINQKLIENKFSPYETISEDTEINKPFTSSAYGNNITVGLTSNTYYYSLNEEEFKQVLTTNVPLATSFVDIAYGNGVFILVSSTGVVQRIKETDIVAEFNAGEQLLNAPQVAYSAIAANGSSFVALTSTGEIYRTDDNGDTWQLAISYQGVQFTSVTAGKDGMFAAVSNTGENRFYISYDYGLTWQAHPMPELNQWADIAYSTDYNAFVACAIDGNNRLAFYDVAKNSWTAIKTPTQAVWRSITVGNGVFICVSSDGKAISSYDGKEWYSIEILNAEWVSSVRSKNFFIVFSSNGKIARSSNGGLTSLLFANSNETLEGTEPTKAISPFTLWQAINSLFPLAINKGGTGATTADVARVNLGLSNVDNTSDSDKPISTAVQTALNGKADSSTVTALSNTVNNKADTSTVTALQTTVNSKANSSDLTALANTVNSKANTSDLAKYLPLTGGTLTGSLTGTNILGQSLTAEKATTSNVALRLSDAANMTSYMQYLYNDGTPILRILNYSGNSSKGQLDIKDNSLHIVSMGKGTGINTAPDSNYTLKVGGKTYIAGTLQTTGAITSPTPADTSDDTTVPTTAWVNRRIATISPMAGLFIDDVNGDLYFTNQKTGSTQRLTTLSNLNPNPHTITYQYTNTTTKTETFEIPKGYKELSYNISTTDEADVSKIAVTLKAGSTYVLTSATAMSGSFVGTHSMQGNELSGSVTVDCSEDVAYSIVIKLEYLY